MRFAPELIPHIRRPALLILFFAFVIGACRSNPPANQQNGKPIPKALSAMSDEELLELVETFSTDIGEEGVDAWKQLQGYSRQELIDRLSQIRGDDDQDDFERTNIAFLMCNLDQDYESNREIIVSAFNQSPDTAELYEVQIDRLIRRGDKGLLQVLFEITPQSDGALSDGLAETFAFLIKTDTEAFLAQLRTQPRSTRSQISEFVNSAASDQDKSAIRTSLRSIPETSQLANLAKEVESDLSQVKFN
jgi:hypothetical protein